MQDVMQWRVSEKMLAWERPLRRADYAALGDNAPDGAILAMWVPDLGVKEALLADDPGVYFTTPTSTAIGRSSSVSRRYPFPSSKS